MQKLILHSCLLIIIAITTSCNKRNDKLILRSLEESINSSNNEILDFTAARLKALEEKTVDYYTKEKAEKWYPIALQIASVGQKEINFIEDKKKKNNLSQTDIDEIYQHALQFGKNIRNTNSEIDTIAKYSQSFIPQYPLSLYADITGSKRILHNQLPINFQMAILSAYKNEIIKIQNRIIGFCSQKGNSIIFCGFETNYPLIEQSGKTFQPGEILEIKAGIGAFSRAAQPTVRINGKKLELNAKGFSLYKMRVTGTPGNHFVPVKIEYFNQTTGKYEIKAVDIKYTVAKPCNE